MQPSQKAIEREFEALRDIRRRSSAQGGPGSLILDPDLPAEQPATAPPPLSPQAAWAAATAGKDHSISPTKSSPSSSGARGAEQDAEGGGNSAVDDPFHLFWVPAHLHPELAPSEFRAFLKEHAHHAPADGAATALGRSSSASAAGLDRKRSMLSRQYKPRDNDGVEEEEEKVVPLRRKTSIFDRQGPQLTINDLQKLEELAEEASKSEDPTKLRRVLRRSMTLNVAPSFLDQMDAVPDAEDDVDAPIIVPPRNQVLKRTARTRIRKPNLSGDGGGHRFPASRRKSARADSVDQVTSPTDGSSSGHGEVEPSTVPPLPPISTPTTTTATPRVPIRRRTLEPEDPQDNRRFTYTDEASIFDAYAESPEDEKPASPPPLPTTQPTARLVVETHAPAPAPAPVLASSRPSISERIATSPPAPGPQPPQSTTTPTPVLHQPQPQRLLSPQQQQALQPSSRSPSPETASAGQEIQRPDSRSSVKSEAHSHHTVSSTVSDKRKEKDKKSLWRKVGGGGSSDKSTKKGAKEKEKEKEKEKDSGFFGSLFGGGKKKQEESPPTGLGGGAGPATAAALLGASKSNNKAYSPSISPQLGNPYARYPIHVERAIYRLSHIKLANPRRPLYEQVLISNLMFWYLGVINKSNQGSGGQNQNSQSQTQNQQQQSQTQAQNGGSSSHGAGAGTSTQDPEKEQLEREREQREREERERAEKERMEAQQQQQQRREPRRGSLTKPPPANSGRRAEMPVKGPQYHIQSQVIEQEYSSVGVGSVMQSASPVTRTSSAPPPSMAQSQGYGMNGGYSRVQSMPPSKPQQQPQQQQMYSQPNGNPGYYYGRSASVDYSSGSSPSSNLPPGAMPPLSTTDPSWLATQVVGGSLPRAQQQSHGYSQSADYDYSSGYNQQPSRPSRSPPGNINNSYEWSPGRNGDLSQSGKLPSRSLSANAVAPVQSHSQGQGMQYGSQGQYSGGGGGMSYGQQEPPSNGRLKKKVASASAVAPDRDRRQRTSDDEDVPLAMWQAQRRR